MLNIRCSVQSIRVLSNAKRHKYAFINIQSDTRVIFMNFFKLSEIAEERNLRRKLLREKGRRNFEI